MILYTEILAKELVQVMDNFDLFKQASRNWRLSSHEPRLLIQ
jgi:hypothetical protein